MSRSDYVRVISCNLGAQVTELKNFCEEYGLDTAPGYNYVGTYGGD